MRSGQQINQCPFTRAVAITLSNVTTYVDSIGSPGTQTSVQQALEAFDAFMANTAGTLIMKDMAGVVNTITLVAGVIYFLKVSQFQTGGTAAGLVGFYY